MNLPTHLSLRFEKLFGDYRKQLARARKTGDEDCVHQLRVASRRILETFRVFDGAVDSAAVKPIRKSLKKWMKGSGSVRDLDIAIQLARESGASDAPGLIALWEDRRKSRWERMLPLLKAGSLWKGTSKVSSVVPEAAPAVQGGIWDSALNATQNASLTLPLMLDRYVMIGDALVEGEAAETDYHSFRLRTKRIRYTVESFEGFYPREAFREVLGKLKGFQQTLGALHDCFVVASLVAMAEAKDLAEGDSSSLEQGAPNDLLHYLDRRSAALRAEWHKNWREFTQPDIQTETRRFLRESAAEPPALPAKRKAKHEGALKAEAARIAS